MYIGKSVLVKHNGIVQKGTVETIFPEDLDVRLENGELVRRKFWEIRKIEVKNEE
jgi:hypothetical protein